LSGINWVKFDPFHSNVFCNYASYNEKKLGQFDSLDELDFVGLVSQFDS